MFCHSYYFTFVISNRAPKKRQGLLLELEKNLSDFSLHRYKQKISFYCLHVLYAHILNEQLSITHLNKVIIKLEYF